MGRILLVEDDPVQLYILRGWLQQAGHTVEGAEDGGAALALARRSAPPLMVTDWLMPGLDGLGLIRAFRRDSGLRDTYVILLTARDEGGDHEAALAGGADDILTKPCMEKEFLARIEAGLRLGTRQGTLSPCGR